MPKSKRELCNWRNSVHIGRRLLLAEKNGIRDRLRLQRLLQMKINMPLKSRPVRYIVFISFGSATSKSDCNLNRSGQLMLRRPSRISNLQLVSVIFKKLWTST